MDTLSCFSVTDFVYLGMDSSVKMYLIEKCLLARLHLLWVEVEELFVRIGFQSLCVKHQLILSNPGLAGELHVLLFPSRMGLCMETMTTFIFFSNLISTIFQVFFPTGVY